MDAWFLTQLTASLHVLPSPNSPILRYARVLRTSVWGNLGWARNMRCY